ncbi:MAG: acyl carrier protein [Pseudomonadota bacterium]
MGIEQQLQEYIIENFMYSGEVDKLSLDLHLFDNGIVDSTGVLELVAFLEESFELQVDDSEMVPENFATISQLAAFVRRKQGTIQGTETGNL